MINIITLIDLVYIAGFLDGDGSIIAQLVSRDDYKWKFQIRLSIQFSQHKKRRIYLEKLKDIIGAGYVRDRKDEISDYVITDIESVFALLQKLQPYLRIKQKQADLTMRIIEQLPASKKSQVKFIELTEIVDHIASLNDTKKNRVITSDTVKQKLSELK